MTEERRHDIRREEDCVHPERIKRIEDMVIGPEGWMAYQKMILDRLDKHSDTLDKVVTAQGDMLGNQREMRAEISNLKKVASSWGGGLGAILGGIVAVVLHYLGMGRG